VRRRALGGEGLASGDLDFNIAAQHGLPALGQFAANRLRQRADGG
jgi:hypothetical protein